MKVLLDENMPHQLRAHFGKHETATASYLGWSGRKNGALLKAAGLAYREAKLCKPAED